MTPSQAGTVKGQNGKEFYSEEIKSHDFHRGFFYFMTVEK